MLYLLVFWGFIALANALAIPKIIPQPLKFDFRVMRAMVYTSTIEYCATWEYSWEGKKRSVYSLPIENYNDISYLIDIYVGSNRQKSAIVLDTGSSHVWLSQNETKLGYFDPSSSTTARKTGVSFLTGYADGSDFNGLYYNDTLGLFGSDYPWSIAVNNFQFGVVQSSSTSKAGILGLADRADEKSLAISNNNFVWGLKEAGYIAKPSFSLYLNSNESNYGSVIFGGIDTEKYVAPLVSYPLNTSSGGLAVNLESINVDGQVFTEGNTYLLDLGTTLGFVSKDVMDHLDSVFSPKFVDLGGIVYRQVSCDQPSDKYFEFNFGSNSVWFLYANAISRQGDTCYLGFTYYNDHHILGDIFLRQAYVYYNLADKIIAIAQARYTSRSSVVMA